MSHSFHTPEFPIGNHIPHRRSHNTGLQDPTLIPGIDSKVWLKAQSDPEVSDEVELDIEEVAGILRRAAALGNTDAQNWLHILVGEDFSR